MAESSAAWVLPMKNCHSCIWGRGNEWHRDVQKAACRKDITQKSEQKSPTCALYNMLGYARHGLQVINGDIPAIWCHPLPNLTIPRATTAGRENQWMKLHLADELTVAPMMLSYCLQWQEIMSEMLAKEDGIPQERAPWADRNLHCHCQQTPLRLRI